jgi:hypothetical protein
MFLKFYISSKYSNGFSKINSKNQKIINKLLKRSQFGNDLLITKILSKYLYNKIKTVYLNFSVRWEKFRIINYKKIKRKGIKNR